MRGIFPLRKKSSTYRATSWFISKRQFWRIFKPRRSTCSQTAKVIGDSLRTVREHMRPPYAPKSPQKRKVEAFSKNLENGGKQNLRACARTVEENSDSPLFMASANSAISRPSTHRETGATLTKLNFLPRYRTRSRNDCRFLAENDWCGRALNAIAAGHAAIIGRKSLRMRDLDNFFLPIIVTFRNTG